MLGRNANIESLLHEASRLADEGDIPGMLERWKSAANAGAWMVCAKIGEYYERGAEGVEPDMTEALYWYRKAVDAGDDPVAHVALARAYWNGDGTERNAELARIHAERALFYGSPEGAMYMGDFYFSGVPYNLIEAQKMFELASSAGYPYARMMLANIAMRKFRFLKAAKLAVSALRLAHKISSEDPADARLLGINLAPKEAAAKPVRER